MTHVVAIVTRCLFWFCVTHSESSTSTIPVPVPPLHAIRDRSPMMSDIGDGEGGPSSAAGASDKSKSLPSKRAPAQAPAQAPAPAPVPPNGPAIIIAAVVMIMTAGQRLSPTRPALKSKFPCQSPNASPITSASGITAYISSRDRVSFVSRKVSLEKNTRA